MGYSHDHKPVKIRRMTLEELKSLRYGQGVPFIAEDGTVVFATVNGNLKTWKRSPNRVRVPWKYGMYEYGAWETSATVGVAGLRNPPVAIIL